MHSGLSNIKKMVFQCWENLGKVAHVSVSSTLVEFAFEIFILVCTTSHQDLSEM